MKWHINILFLLFTTPLAHTARVIQGNDPNSPKGFKSKVTQKVFDRVTGTLYVGLENDTAPNNSSNYSISKAFRPQASMVATFTPIARDNTTNSVDLIDKTIEFLTFSEKEESPWLLGVVTENDSSTALTQNFFIALPTTQSPEPLRTQNLHDASGTDETEGIIALAARPDHFLAVVRPNGGDFGTANGGIALVGIDRDSQGNLTDLDEKDAVTGLDGNSAIELEVGSDVIDGGTNAVTMQAGEENNVTFYYDEVFDRFYLGIKITTDSNMNDIGKAIVTARVDIDSGGEVKLEDIVANTAISATPTNEIVVSQSAGANDNLSIKFIKTMHTSTGPSYLIVNGGKDTADMVGNMVFALPLVYDENSESIHGTLAKKDSALATEDNVFNTPATASGDLATATDPAALVGAGAAPLAVDDDISDMVVVGDTVYISINEEQSATNDTGIWYSQALFDDTGKIIRWTPWARRVIPLNAFPNNLLPNNTQHSGAVAFFDIDAKTGNVWVVEGDTQRVVGSTAWSVGSDEDGLIAQLFNQLSQGSFCALDLHAATNNFSGNTNHRYALFGGVNRVVFARTSEQIAVQQDVIDDFSDPENFLVTQCPGCVRTLEYGRRPDGTADNYFFAGSERGLYVFADDATGGGFDVTALEKLDAAPFTTYTWQKAPNIPGAVIDIKSSGNGNLYVMTLEQTNDPTKPLKNTIYSIPFLTTIATMFAPGNIRTIAQTGVGIFANITQFFGMQIIATGALATPTTAEQLILATNQGLFYSDELQGAGIPDATDQTDADWTLFTDTAATTFWGIAGINTPIKHTVWPFSAQDRNGFATFDRGDIHQVHGHSDDGTAPLLSNVFIPETFNSADEDNTAFETLEPINAFWSDGARRFFVANRTIDPGTENKLSVVPFDTFEWGCINQQMLNDPTTTIPERLYWIEQIGATGLLLAGGGQGVIGLE